MLEEISLEEMAGLVDDLRSLPPSQIVAGIPHIGGTRATDALAL